MGYSSAKLTEIVDRSVQHKWSIPEFQRGFVWKPKQVCDLIESLWLDYPVGTLLVWDSSGVVETRSASDAKTPPQWLVDGQQRTTAFCILSGRKPYWWNEGWDSTVRRYDIRFDVHARVPPYFVVANAATRKAKETRFIPVRKVLALDTSKDNDQRQLQELAKQIKVDGFCDGMDAMEVFTRLDRLRKVRDKEVVLVTVDNELEDVVEIFARLNGRGTRVTEADVYLGVVAARAPGWVRDEYLPFVRSLGEAGFDVTPNLVFRTLTGIGKKRIRYKFIDDSFWDAQSIKPAWARAKDAWGLTIKQFKDRGVSGNALLPADNALVPLVSLMDKYPDQQFDRVFYWFLQASRFGRYSASGTTSMEEDLREIEDSSSITDALERLLRRIAYLPPLSKDDFLRDYADARFGRLLLYLLVCKNAATDWDEKGVRIGFDGSDLLVGFQPQFHHIFPSAFLGNTVDSQKIDGLANIAIIGPKINIRISKQNPMNYFDRYQISNEKLAQQLIAKETRTTPISEYCEWLDRRAESLARAGNSYLESLRGILKLPVLQTGTQAVEYAYDTA